MKKIVLLCCCSIITCWSIAQTTEELKKKAAEVKEQTRKIQEQGKAIDSFLQHQSDSLRQKQLQRELENNNRNLDAFVAMQKERDAKQKKQMWFRLGFGGLMLVVLIVGLARRKKAAQKG